MSEERVAALRQALEADPSSHTLRLMLAETLQELGRDHEACDAYRALLDAGALPHPECVRVGELALALGDLELVGRCLDEARHAGVVEGVQSLQDALDRRRSDHGVLRLVRSDGSDARDATGPGSLREDARVSFGEIGGLDGVKKAVHRMIILPTQRPDLYERYKQTAGGGVLLFGPPGCGKTLLARATAHECGLPFFNVRIEEVLGPYLGESERNLHLAFEQAREAAPAVVFLDELDAIAFARSKHHGSAGRALVDQLLQELDSIGGENRELLVLGATNAPWDVDDALKRPGRFDRVVFVPPPDAPARHQILEGLLEGRPVRSLDLDALVEETPLYSGADLRALVDRAFEDVIDEALASDAEPPLEMRHFRAVLEDARPTTLDWLTRARNYVEFANRDERYKDVEAFLRSREVKRYRL